MTNTRTNLADLADDRDMSVKQMILTALEEHHGGRCRMKTFPDDRITPQKLRRIVIAFALAAMPCGLIAVMRQDVSASIMMMLLFGLGYWLGRQRLRGRSARLAQRALILKGNILRLPRTAVKLKLIKAHHPA
jgi:hypothetical protein